MKSAAQAGSLGSSIAVIGLGNIGSQVVPLLAGISGLMRVMLVDPDCYSASNVGAQHITAKDVGRSKPKVQARVLGALAPHIAVDTFGCSVEAMPLGRLRHCVILSCVDSRLARQSINRIAWRLGRPWIDAGLDRAGSVRARVYAPDKGDCLECNWGERDYELLEQRMPCSASSSPAFVTEAPVEVGAIAAALQVSRLRRLLSEEPGAEDELAHQQQFLDLSSGRGWIVRYGGKNPNCRFEHARWPLTPLPRSARDICLYAVFALAGKEADNATISVDGQTFVRRMRCARCGTVKSTGGRVFHRIKAALCRRCGDPTMPAAMDITDNLFRKDMSADWLERPLAAFGLTDGDIITLHTENTAVHYLLGSANTETF